MSSPLESQLGYTFRRPELLKLALTHASWGHEQRKQLAHNERLEFLGDAVLQMIVSEYLYHLDTHAAEGRLTKIRAHLVNRSSLVEMAKRLDLGTHLLLGKAEATQGGRKRASNLANAMEAVIGAVFLDGGFEAARALIIHRIKSRLEEVATNPEPENAKGILQEKLHTSGRQAVYQIVSEKGPPHRREFQAAVTVGGRALGRGTGTTKKEAEMRAAMAALAALSNGESAFGDL